MSFVIFVTLSIIKGPKLFEHTYNQQPSHKLLDNFIVKTYQEDIKTRKLENTTLVSELYKLQDFDWGGLYQNNLERSIVDNYVKKIKNLSVLNKKIEVEIHHSMKSYVLSSWFNHWTSILIEDLFKKHKKVIPAVGLIKKVDFFIQGIPFDLKVTYFPDGFMQIKRKEMGLKSEVQELKTFADRQAIRYDTTQKDKAVFMELVTRFKESIEPEVKRFWIYFNKTRQKIIRDTIKNPYSLIRWLYEQQGERRFDAANRLFLILIDQTHLEESWKMKRNINLLKKQIKLYLDKVDLTDLKQFKVTFNWKDGRRYCALSDALFITRK